MPDGRLSESGVLLFAALKTRYDLFIAPAGGGEPRQIALPGLPEGRYFSPEFLPGTEDFLVTFEPPGASDGETFERTYGDDLVPEDRARVIARLRTRQWPLRPARTSARMRSPPRSAKAGWARSIGPPIPD